MRLKQNKEGETLDSKDITWLCTSYTYTKATAVTNDPGKTTQPRRATYQMMGTKHTMCKVISGSGVLVRCLLFHSH